MRIFIFILLVALSACDGTPLKTEAGEIRKDSIDRANELFYPISSFIRQELKTADENPSAITLYVTENEKMDSGYVPFDSLKFYARYFTKYDLNERSTRKFVKEESFRDESVDAVTLTYTLNSEKVPLKRADVLIKEEATKNAVNSVYLEETEENDGVVINRKLYWKSGKSCMIIEQITDEEGNEKVRQIKLAWNQESSI